MAKIKGVALIDGIRAVCSRDGEQKYAQVLQLLEPETRTVLTGVLSPNAWYAMDTFTEFLHADVVVTAGGDPERLTLRSELVAERHLRGVYRAFARVCSTAFFVERLSAVHKSYFLDVGLEVARSGPHSMSLTYTGFEPRHEIMRYVMLGFFRKSLSLSGAKGVRIEFQTPAPSARRSWVLAVSWSAPQDRSSSGQLRDGSGPPRSR